MANFALNAESAVFTAIHKSILCRYCFSRRLDNNIRLKRVRGERLHCIGGNVTVKSDDDLVGIVPDVKLTESGLLFQSGCLKKPCNVALQMEVHCGIGNRNLLLGGERSGTAVTATLRCGCRGGSGD